MKMLLFITSLLSLNLSVLTAQSHNAVVMGQDVMVTINSDTIIFYDAVVAFHDGVSTIVETPMTFVLLIEDGWYTIYKESYTNTRNKYSLYANSGFNFWVKRDINTGKIISFQYTLFDPPTTVAGSVEFPSY